MHINRLRFSIKVLLLNSLYRKRSTRIGGFEHFTSVPPILDYVIKKKKVSHSDIELASYIPLHKCNIIIDLYTYIII